MSDLRLYHSTVEKYADRPNVHFVRYGSSDYYRALATSEFLVNNATFPPSFSKRPGQVYLNTWHGTPLKRMGYDIEDGALATANIIRNFAAADYLLAQNPFMTDQMYASAYKLTGIYRGSVIEEGYPRTDRQVLNDDEARAARDQLTDAGITAGDRQIILYAPTWKGLVFNDPTTTSTSCCTTWKTCRAGSTPAGIACCSKRTRSCTNSRRTAQTSAASWYRTSYPPT